MSTEKQLSNINFFICSTFEDLKQYRENLIAKIKSKSGIINAQEFFGSRDKQAIETCLEEVKKSDVFIMFLAMRYGSIEKKSGKSFVECEYEKAKEIKLPKFVYFLDENHPFPPKYYSDGKGAESLALFKKKLLKELTIDNFTTPDDLSEKVLKDLIRELPSKGFTIGKEPDNIQVEDTAHLLKSFLLLPKRNYGRQFDIAAKFGDTIKRADKEECSAFSMRYGATIKRDFESADKKISNALGDLKTAFAQEEMADIFMRAPGKTDLKVTLKTIQGVYRWEEPIYEKYYDLLQSVPICGGLSQKIITGYLSKERFICGLEIMKID